MTNRFHRILLSALILTCIVHGQPPCDTRNLLLGEGTDLPGTPIVLENPHDDGQGCAFLCLQNSECRGYNFIRSQPQMDTDTVVNHTTSLPSITPSTAQCPLTCPNGNGAGCCWLKSSASSVNLTGSSVCSSVNGCSFIMRPDPATLPPLPSPPPIPNQAKNVIYILVDDMRPDAAPFGISFMQTPSLTKLASTGTVFNRTYCNIAVCSPSRNSFLTGKYPHNTVVWNFINHFRQASCVEEAGVTYGLDTPYLIRTVTDGGAGQCCTFCTSDSSCTSWTLDGSNCELYRQSSKVSTNRKGVISGISTGNTNVTRNFISLPQHFTNNGWLTLQTGKIFHTEEGGNGGVTDSLSAWDGPATGMPPLQDPWSWSRGNYSMANVNSIAPMRPCENSCSINATIEGDVNPNTTFRFCDKIIGDDALYKLNLAATNYAQTKQPFLLAVGLRKPHLPFRHPSPYDTLYPDPSVIPLAKYKTLDKSTPPIAFYQTSIATNPYTPIPDEQAGTLRRDYYAAISWIDHQIGRIMDELDSLSSQGILNASDTLIVFHADHAWSLGEHGEWEKFTNYEHGTRVPLIIRAPFISGSAGIITNTITELIDVYPTIADLAGIPAPGDYNLDGSSLRSVLDYETMPTTEDSTLARYPPPSPHINNYALSVYPRCPADLANTSNYWANNDCLMTERINIPFMGISLRVDQWRYTEWRYWNSTSLSPNWTIDPVGIELYNHAEDDSSTFDGSYEQFNLAGLSQYKTIQQQLATQLQTVYPSGEGWPNNNPVPLR